ncbi:MAG: hypothetical protein ACK4FL_02835, partial [Microgenomates group bacterium]
MKEFFLKLISQKLIIRVGLILFTIILSSILIYNYINQNLYKSKASYPCGRNAHGQCSGDCPSGQVCSLLSGNCVCIQLRLTPTPTPTPRRTPRRTPTPNQTPTPTPTPNQTPTPTPN